MTGKVYFKDGHTEDIMHHDFDPTNIHRTTQVNFTTESGSYLFYQRVVYVTDDMGAIYWNRVMCAFYKCTDKLIFTTDIDHLEFNMEVQ